MMDIRLVTRRSVVLLLATTIAGAAFVAGVALVHGLGADRAQPAPLAGQMAVALLIALGFQPLKRWIQRGLDRSLRRETRDERRILRDASRSIDDLSGFKALEGERRRAERLASLGALASGIAHEIKNPLVAIKTFAELLPERFTDADFREDFARVVTREIERIDDLVARLRGIAAPAPPPACPVDLREPILDTITLLRGQLEQTRTVVHRDFEDPAPCLAIDATRLKQLFLNLFINAIQAMGPGGELTVRITRREHPGGARVVAEVADTGPGMPEAIRARAFDPFFTTKAGGSGLGLAICRAIVDAHEGTIRAVSNSTGPGTTIIVEFPTASPARPPAPRAALVG